MGSRCRQNLKNKNFMITTSFGRLRPKTTPKSVPHGIRVKGMKQIKKGNWVRVMEEQVGVMIGDPVMQPVVVV